MGKSYFGWRICLHRTIRQLQPLRPSNPSNQARPVAFCAKRSDKKRWRKALGFLVPKIAPRPITRHSSALLYHQIPWNSWDNNHKIPWNSREIPMKSPSKPSIHQPIPCSARIPSALSELFFQPPGGRGFHREDQFGELLHFHLQALTAGEIYGDYRDYGDLGYLGP
jgi:hypothetical protein